MIYRDLAEALNQFQPYLSLFFFFVKESRMEGLLLDMY